MLLRLPLLRAVRRTPPEVRGRLCFTGDDMAAGALHSCAGGSGRSQARQRKATAPVSSPVACIAAIIRRSSAEPSVAQHGGGGGGGSGVHRQT